MQSSATRLIEQSVGRCQGAVQFGNRRREIHARRHDSCPYVAPSFLGPRDNENVRLWHGRCVRWHTSLAIAIARASPFLGRQHPTRRLLAASVGARELASVGGARVSRGREFSTFGLDIAKGRRLIRIFDERLRTTPDPLCSFAGVRSRAERPRTLSFWHSGRNAPCHARRYTTGSAQGFATVICR